MKKIVLLAFGIVLVVAILMLLKGVAPSRMKRMMSEISQVLEASIIKVYRDIRSFGTDIEGI